MNDKTLPMNDSACCRCAKLAVMAVPSNGSYSYYCLTHKPSNVGSTGPSDFRDYDPTDTDVARDVIRALKVLVHTPATRAWLETNDPKALAQAEKALTNAQGSVR